MPETTRHQSAIGATLAGLTDRFGSRGPRVHLADEVRLDGKLALVTGASRGLGLAIATGLAQRGATVLMAMRSRAEEALAEVRRAAPGAQVEALPVDLADVASVDRLADAIRDRGTPLDLVVLNAGVVPASSRQTGAGLDLMVHVHLVANAQLVDRLLADGTLRTDGAAPPRIVVVGSEAHRSAEVDPDHWHEPQTYGTSQVMAHYGKSKLLLHAWTVELARRLDGPDRPSVGVHHLCPGAVASEIAREAPGWVKPALGLVMRALFQSPERAARPVLYLAAAPELDEQTGVYLHLDQPKACGANARDAAFGRAVWARTESLLDTLRAGA